MKKRVNATNVLIVVGTIMGTILGLAINNKVNKN